MADFAVLPSSDQVARHAAYRIRAALDQGARTLVLAGGNTPKACYELLARSNVKWGRVTILFSDERCVPPDDPESNYRMARETLLDRVSPVTVHRIPGELGAEEAAAHYDRVVERLAPLDVVLLGAGEDGHTASLFPGHPEVAAKGWAVAVHNAPKPPPDRVSLTLPALRASRQVIVLATGAGKADAVGKARRGEVPSGMIAGALWLIDRAAAGQ